jgi:hypothetical protein
LTSALIGHTGLVGGHLSRHFEFDYKVNSSNPQSIAGTRQQKLVISAMPAEKWRANLNPNEDKKNLTALIDSIDKISSADEVILISTVDVFPMPTFVFESSKINRFECQPYGYHRLLLEDYIKKRFKRSYIVRLPALVGSGLKKNVLFDLKNNKDLTQVPINSIYQFYPLSRIGNDLDVITNSKPGLYHLTSHPLMIQELVLKLDLNPHLFGSFSPNPPNYDFRTSHAVLWGKNQDYQVSLDEVYDSISEYLSW